MSSRKHDLVCYGMGFGTFGRDFRSILPRSVRVTRRVLCTLVLGSEAWFLWWRHHSPQGTSQYPYVLVFLRSQVGQCQSALL